MNCFRTAAALAALVAIGSTGAVLAQTKMAGEEDPIASRQMIMDNNGAAAKVATTMIKGEMPFDAGTAELVFHTLNSSSYAFGHYFPESSKTGKNGVTGKETAAAPAIWEKPDDFQAALAKLQADTGAAIKAKPASLDDFKQAFGKVADNCKTCHETFRLKKQ